MTPQNPAAERTPVISYPTPRGREDVLFFESRDGRIAPNQRWAYGEAHPNAREFPNHKLVLVEPRDEARGMVGWQRWWYAADRSHQTDYNAERTYPWPDKDFFVVTRRFVVPRAGWQPLAPYIADPVFPSHKLVGQRQVDIDVEQLRSLYVVHELTYEVLPGYIAQSVADISKAETVTYTQRVNPLNPGEPPAAPASGTWTRLKAEVSPAEPGVSVWEVVYQRRHQVLTFTTPKQDVVFFELHDSATETPPVYGTAHGDPAFSTYVLSFVSPVDDNGFQKWFYVCPRDEQHKYNYEYERGTPGNQWPSLKQVFFLPRATYAFGQTYTRPTIAGVATNTFTPISERLLRTGDETLDGVFVVVELVFEKLSALIGYEIDELTGKSFATTIEKVPAGTPGSPVDSTGVGSEVSPINSDFSLRTTKTFVGLATETLVYESVDNFSWPPVLLGVELDVVMDPTQTEIVSVLVNNRWKTRGYNGPCRMIVTESWQKEPPTVVIPPQMILTPIEFNGLYFDLRVEPCLHPTIGYFETTGTESSRYAYFGKSYSWPATNFTDWPESIIVRSAPVPFRGGFRTRTIEVFSPKGNRAA